MLVLRERTRPVQTAQGRRVLFRRASAEVPGRIHAAGASTGCCRRDAPKDTGGQRTRRMTPLTAESRDPNTRDPQTWSKRPREQKTWEQKAREQKSDQRPQLGGRRTSAPAGSRIPGSLNAANASSVKTSAAALSPAAGIASAGPRIVFGLGPAVVSGPKHASTGGHASSGDRASGSERRACKSGGAANGPPGPRSRNVSQTLYLRPFPRRNPGRASRNLRRLPACPASWWEFPLRRPRRLSPGRYSMPTRLAAEPTLSLPRLQEFKPDPDAAYLDPAERITLFLRPP